MDKKIRNDVSSSVLLNAAFENAQMPDDVVLPKIEYTDEQVQNKIEFLLHLVEDIPEKKEYIKKAFALLAQTQIGQNLIMQAPRDIPLRTAQFCRENVFGSYRLESKEIVISSLYINVDETLPNLAVTLAHEMRHAIQDKQGLLVVNLKNPTNALLLNIMFELETTLQDALLAQQLYEKGYSITDKTGRMLFYKNESDALLKQGFSTEEAQQKAKDNLIQMLLSAGQYKGCAAEVSSDDIHNFDLWKRDYEKQAIRNIIHHKTQADLTTDEIVVPFLKNMGSCLSVDDIKNTLGVYIKMKPCRFFIAPAACEIYYDDGTLKSRFEFKNGSFDGVIKYCYPNGQVQMIQHYKDGILHGSEMIIDENGERVTGHYKNGIFHGDMILYYKNGAKKAVFPLKNGRLNGKLLTYNKDGSLHSSFEVRDDKKHGKAVKINKDGSKVEEEYKNDKLHGTVRKYDADGVLISCFVYEDGEVISKHIFVPCPEEEQKVEESFASANALPKECDVTAVLPKVVSKKENLAILQHKIKTR